MDRDEHIKINFNKLTEDLANQYLKMDDSQPNYYNVKYDLFSIMQYGTSDKIIQSLDASREFLMGQRVGLSFLDIEMANKAYYCSDSCPRRGLCQNGAFIGPGCKCFCPDGLTGSLCETVIPNMQNGNNQIDLTSFNLNQTQLDCDFSNFKTCNWKNDIRGIEKWKVNDPYNMGFTDGQIYFQKNAPKIKIGPQNGDRNSIRRIFSCYFLSNTFRLITV